MIDEYGNVVYSRTQGSLNASTVYRDTFHLNNNNCYKFLFIDNDDFGGDGLSFWANPDAGTGSLKLKKASNGSIIKTFQGDFGGEVLYYFSTNTVVTEIDKQETTNFSVEVFPNPNNGDFILSVINPELIDWNYSITNALGQIIKTSSFKNSQAEMNTISMKDCSDGIYFIDVQNGSTQTIKKIMIQH